MYQVMNSSSPPQQQHSIWSLMHSPGTVCRLGKLDPKTVAVVRL